MEIKTALLLENSKKPEIKHYSEQIVSYLKNKNINVSELFLSATDEDVNLAIPKADIAISLGGDGTVLSSVRLLKGTGIPLLAVKLGTFGYITETSTQEFEQVFENILSGVNPVVEKMMLSAKVFRNGKEVYSNDAFNEITVSSGEVSKLMKLNLSINDVFAANIRSDGIIFSTPTGSTAYNLAAGGPIVDSEVEAIIVNPICPFTMSVRPLVVSNTSKISVQLPAQHVDCLLIFDGHESFRLETDDEIVITKSRFSTLLLRNKKRNSIEILRDKLGWAGGFND